MVRRVVLAVTVLFVCAAGVALPAQAPGIVYGVWDLPGVSVAVDPSGAATLGDAISGRLHFEAAPANLAPLNGSASSLHPLTVWVRIPAPSMPAASGPWYLEGSRYVATGTVYARPAGSSTYTGVDFGGRVPFADRGVKRAIPTARIPGSTATGSPIYLRMSIDLEFVPLSIENQSAIDAGDLATLHVQRSVMLLCGIFLTLGLCNLLVFASTRELPYALYSISMLTLAAIGPMQSSELAWEILWPHASLSDMWTRYPALFLEGYVSFAFVYTFLRTWEYAPVLNRIARVVLIVWPLLDFVAVFLFPSIPLGHGLSLADFQAFMMTLMFGLMVVLSAAGVRAKIRGAWFFVVGYGVVAVTYGSYAYSTYFWNDAARAWTYLALLYSRVFEGFALFWALADRLQWTMKAHLNARSQALEATQQLLLETKLSTSDPLTGIANRRAFDKTLAAELLRAGRSASPLSLLLLDVDNFKLYNDRYGHVAGDECLKAVASTVAGALNRPDDLVARYGGEEFAVILPNTDEAGALAIAQDVCSAIYALQIPHEDSSHGVVSISIGVATDRDFPSFASALIEKADAGLYLAKATGRNKIAASG
jgi:diguanylate cyclase (GGDEF)-like protein